MRHERETFADNVPIDNATCPQLRLQIGDAIFVEDTFFEILGSDSHGVNGKAIGSGRFQKTFEHAELFRLYYAGKLKIQRAGFGRVRPVVARNLRKPIAAFSEADQDEALARYEYVQMFHRLYQAKKVKKTAEGYAKAVELTAWLRRRREAAEKGVPARAVGLECWSWSSLRNWYGDWVGSGCQLVALVPANASKGRHGTRLDPVVLRIVAKFVTERWLTLERPPLSVVHEEICCEVLRVNDGRHENQRLPEPDVNSVRRWIDSNFDEYEIVAARHGKDAADQRCRPVKAAPRGRWPGNIVELDHTRMDVFAVTQDGKPVTGDFETSRPWIMALICTLTRMILGFWITLEPPSWVTLMHCLRHAVLPKDVSHVPGIQSPYPTHGLFDLLRVDNDRIFRSRSLLLASAQLNFTIDWGPKGVSRMRGTIERHFREFERQRPLHGARQEFPERRGEGRLRQRGAGRLPAPRDQGPCDDLGCRLLPQQAERLPDVQDAPPDVERDEAARDPGGRSR